MSNYPDLNGTFSKFKQTLGSLETDNSFFISFEGIEGAGKSTHMNQLKVDLEDRGYQVTLLREPGGTSFGEALRDAILNSREKLHPLAEAFLFASSRAQLLGEVIIEKLKQPGSIIICDRHLDSSLAYQGVARGLGIETILDIHKFPPLNITPHMTLYIKISVETSMERQGIRNASKDYFESENGKFYQKLVEGYDRAQAIFPERILTIDGEQNIASVYNDIQQKINTLITKNAI